MVVTGEYASGTIRPSLSATPRRPLFLAGKAVVAGAISTYVGVTFLLPLLLHQLAGNPARYTPVQILANSVAVTVTDHSQVSATVGLVLMVAYTAAVLAAGVVLFRSRDA